MLDPKLQAAVTIEPMALEEEFVRVPSDLAFWNEQYAISFQLYLEKKMVRELTYARLYNMYKTQLSLSGKGRVTEGEVESAITMDEGFQNAKVSEIQAESDKVRLWGIMDSLRSKRDMLVSIGAHQRATMQMDPSIRQHSAIQREYRENGQGGGGK